MYIFVIIFQSVEIKPEENSFWLFCVCIDDKKHFTFLILILVLLLLILQYI